MPYTYLCTHICTGQSDMMGMLSLATTCLCLGVKVAKVGELPKLMQYRSKQKAKVAHLQSLMLMRIANDSAE